MGNVLVTGGAGFIGSRLVRKLSETGHKVIVVDDLRAGKSERIPKDITLYRLDINETDALKSVMRGIETVFHLAALPRVQQSIEDPVGTTHTNLTGTVSVLTAAAQAGVRRIVYSSSAAVYGFQETSPLHEGLRAAPVNPYGLQKYMGEYYAKMWSEIFSLETVCLRYFNVYGPGMDPSGPYGLALGKFLNAWRYGEPITIYGDGTVTRDYVHVDDVVSANIHAAKSTAVGKGEVLNVGTGKNISILELARMFDCPIEFAPPRIEAHDSCANISRTRDLLQWEPTVALEEGVRDLKKVYNDASAHASGFFTGEKNATIRS